MNLISGKVVLKESGVGIPDLLVVIHDVDPETAAEENIPPVENAISRSTAPRNQGIGDRLGSRITGRRGEFEFQFEDDEFRIRNAEEKRPDLLLLVVAPEEPGSDPKTRVLYTSPEIRQNAGRIEQYLIRLPAEALQKAGIPLPVDPSIAAEEPRTTVTRLTQAVSHRVEIEKETRRIASEQVAAVRAAAEKTNQAIEKRLLESLLGVTAEQAENLNIVLPGGDVPRVMWKVAGNSIAKNINGGPLAGYLVLTEDEADRFRDSDGEFRAQISQEEIEPIIYKANREARRPTFLVRDDPAMALCRSQRRPDPFRTSDSGSDANGGGTGSGSGSANSPGNTANGEDGGEFSAQDLPRFVRRLVEDLVPPLNGTANGPTRPTATDVQTSIKGLQLKSGPADVTAFYDFHQLQIAFDYVWQHAVDEGIIEAGTALGRELQEQGGDPVSALNGGGDPIRALRRETQHVLAAQKSLQRTGIAYRMVNDTADAGGNPATVGQVPNPTLPTRPPHITEATGVNVNGVFTADAKPTNLLNALEDMLNERYKFEVFAPGSSNFGLLVTYRQKWEPVTYQVGDLVKTLTLAPKETRKITSKHVVRKERSVKEMESNQRNRKDESSNTMRDESEIVQKAQNKTTFNVVAKGSYDIGISDGDSTTTFNRDAETSSQETKKSFHEAVLKAAQEFRDERKIEVETKSFDETETTDVAEICNPNDELTVTYLFYELQRRFLVSESINRLTPVVLVAMEVPNPNRAAIDKVLATHAWVINRVLLDDRYRAALDYLCNRSVGEELALSAMASNVANVRAAVEELKKMHKDLKATRDNREKELEAAISERANRVAHESEESLLGKGWDFLAGEGSGEDLEAARIIEDAKKEAYERMVREEKELRMRLDAETSALSAVTQSYARAQAEHTNNLLQIAGLRAHFKENVLYYMQAIWNFTFQDQIFFQLSSVKVPKLTAVQKTYSIAVANELPLSIVPRPGQVVLEVRAEVQLNSNLDPTQDFVTLAEIADLDKPLGFKGNYMIFPLKQSNALTDFMMLPYIDSELGLHDPDEFGSWTPQDFARYAKCLQNELKEQLTEAEFLALQDQLKQQYRRIVSNPRLSNDEVIVPTSSLYIEALPGAHPLLEDFKQLHRQTDVKKAEAETAKIRMEVLRYAARILDGDLDDPDIERQVRIQGSSDHIVVPPEA